jgi:hypothetical protein
MHSANVEDEELALPHQDGALAVLPTAEGQDRVLQSLAAILGHDRV